MTPSRPRRLAALLLGLAAVLPVAACSDSSPAAPAAASAGQADADPAAPPAIGATLDAAAFADLASAQDVVVLDVRTPAEFAEGHLPGAVNLDVSDPGFTAGLSDLDKDATYAVYCRSGNRSQAALDVMRDQGFTSAAHLAGGIGAWSAAGGEVVTD